jgi:hypothetical protein
MNEALERRLGMIGVIDVTDRKLTFAKQAGGCFR